MGGKEHIAVHYLAIPRSSRHVTPRGTWRDDRGIAKFCVMIAPHRAQKKQHLRKLDNGDAVEPLSTP